MSLISDFISSVQSIYATGNATEHSYRSCFEALFAALDQDVRALNEPRRVKCGAPDFIVTKGDIVIGHVEAKDLRMAGKANLIKDVLGKTLREDDALQSELGAQFSAFKENLIHDITAQDFADIYAETIAYGMFAARLHDTTLDTFSRQEALELLPKSNPSRAGQPERAGVAHLTHMAITSPPIRTHAGERRCLVRLSIAELPTHTGRRGRSARAYRAT